MSDYRNTLRQSCEEQIFEIPPYGGREKAMPLDEHQQDAMMEMAIALEEGADAFSIVHSCGSGKTISEGGLLVASQRTKEQLGQKNRKDLIITTQRALIYGIREELLKLGLDVGIWADRVRDLNHSVILASIQALHNNTREELDRLLPRESVDLIIGDEADCYLSKARKKIIEWFSSSLKVGFTATPTWPDKRDISEVWGRKIHSMSLKEGILKGVNVPPLFYLFEANIDESQLKVEQGEYAPKVLGEVLKTAEIHKAIPEVYKTLIAREKRKEYPTLVFVPSVDLVRDVTQSLRENFAHEGISVSKWIGHETSSTQMRKDIEAFNRGEIDVLVLCEMGGRGLNLPRARCLIDAYPTLSPTKLEQRHGRVLRRMREESNLTKSGVEKPFALVAQIAPRSKTYRPYFLPDLLDCWEDFQEGRVLGKRSANHEHSTSDHPEPKIQTEVEELRMAIERRSPECQIRIVQKSDVYQQLKLRASIPQARRDGFFTLNVQGPDGEMKPTRYGTVHAWAIELSTCDRTIEDGLSGRVTIPGLDVMGKTRDFYSEDDVMVLREKASWPRANPDGFFEYKNERYGTCRAWGRELQVDKATVKSHLKEVIGMNGKNSNGKPSPNGYYSWAVIREKCPELLKKKDALESNDEGFLMKDGIKYGTREAWSRVYDISAQKLKEFLNGALGITAKLKKGGLTVENGFYSEAQILKAAAHLIGIPKANGSGFIVFDEESGNRKPGKYGSIGAWAKEFGAFHAKVALRVKGLTGIDGRNGAGIFLSGAFLHEDDVREACKDILDSTANLPKLAPSETVGSRGIGINNPAETSNQVV